MKRRTVLAALAAGVAGCSSQGERTTRTKTTTRSRRATKTTSSTATPETRTAAGEETETGTEDSTTTESTPEHLDVGVVYIPFAGDKFGDCTTVSHPEAGQYGDPIPPSVTKKHAEWLSEAGVSTVMFNFGEEQEDYERLRAFLRADLGDLSVEPFYVISQAISRNRDIEADFEFLRETLLSTDRCKMRDGRPVVTFWDFDFLVWGGNEASKEAMQLIEERGGPAGFVDYLREQLTVDGTEPFLVGDLFDHAIGGFPERYAELNRHLDGATSWITAFGDTGQNDWPSARDHAARNFEALRTFCDEHGMAFHPMVYPGFDDRHNSCWGSDRHIPRSPDHLRELFELASQYGTGRANVATFNDWTEGHQIEPGRLRDEAYGTDYLDVVAEFTA